MSTREKKKGGGGWIMAWGNCLVVQCSPKQRRWRTQRHWDVTGCANTRQCSLGEEEASDPSHPGKIILGQQQLLQIKWWQLTLCLSGAAPWHTLHLQAGYFKHQLSYICSQCSRSAMGKFREVSAPASLRVSPGHCGIACPAAALLSDGAIVL